MALDMDHPEASRSFQGVDGLLQCGISVCVSSSFYQLPNVSHTFATCDAAKDDEHDVPEVLRKRSQGTCIGQQCGGVEPANHEENDQKEERTRPYPPHNSGRNAVIISQRLQGANNLLHPVFEVLEHTHIYQAK